MSAGSVSSPPAWVFWLPATHWFHPGLGAQNRRGSLFLCPLWPPLLPCPPSPQWRSFVQFVDVDRTFSSAPEVTPEWMHQRFRNVKCAGIVTPIIPDIPDKQMAQQWETTDQRLVKWSTLKWRLSWRHSSKVTGSSLKICHVVPLMHFLRSYDIRCCPPYPQRHVYLTLY